MSDDTRIVQGVIRQLISYPSPRSADNWYDIERLKKRVIALESALSTQSDVNRILASRERALENDLSSARALQEELRVALKECSVAIKQLMMSHAPGQRGIVVREAIDAYRLADELLAP